MMDVKDEKRSHSYIEVANLGTKVQLLLPGLKGEINDMARYTDEPSQLSAGQIREAFLERAREELEKLGPKL